MTRTSFSVPNERRASLPSISAGDESKLTTRKPTASKGILRKGSVLSRNSPISELQQQLQAQKQQENKRRQVERRKSELQQHTAIVRQRTPSPVAGRTHMDVQTDPFLEELADKVAEENVYTQTDAFMDRPVTPLFVPKSSGFDKATQIVDGELFDFDLEVQPILEVLVGKTLEQAWLEMQEEDELAALRSQQRVFESKRQVELAQTQRMELSEKRRQEEKERRLNEQLRIRLEKKEQAERTASKAFANKFISDLIPSIVEQLGKNGLIQDPVEAEVIAEFLPWLSHETQSVLNDLSVAQSLVDDLLFNALATLRSF